jgi:cutinase
VLYGDTKNKQSNGQIEGFPKDKLLSLCEKDDGVCWGGLSVTAGHLVYTTNGDQARSAQWLKGKIDAALAAKGKPGKSRIMRRFHF